MAHVSTKDVLENKNKSLVSTVAPDYIEPSFLWSP